MIEVRTNNGGLGEKVVVVSVTYNPDTAAFLAQMMAVAAMNCTSIVVDNGSSADFREWLSRNTNGDMRVILLEGNRGIAAAQNVGVNAAQDCIGSHVLMLDHDSVPRPGMVGHLLRAMNDKVSQGIQVAAVGPLWVDAQSGRAASFVRLGWFGYRRAACSEAPQAVIEADLLLSSGMLIDLRAWNAIGPMREELFVDHVDTDWCLRARSAGWSLYGVCGAMLDHSLGERAIRIWAGRMRTLYVHNPERLYYYLRNAISLAKFDSTPVRWTLAELPRACGLLAMYLLFVAPRLSYLIMICRAVRDGVSGHLGPLNRAP